MSPFPAAATSGPDRFVMGPNQADLAGPAHNMALEMPLGPRVWGCPGPSLLVLIDVTHLHCCWGKA